MTRSPILTSEQRDEFQRRGLLRLPGLLSADRARVAREHVQRRLEPLGLWRDGQWRLDALPRPQWPDTGLKPSKAIGNKHPDVEALIEEPALLAVVDGLLEGRSFERAIYQRPQVLFSLPNADQWTTPTGWHVDLPRLASGRAPGVQMFACLDHVEPGGGGTAVVAGSHLLGNEGRHLRVADLAPRLRRETFFRDLYAGAPTASRTGMVGDVALEIVELTGDPGDAWLMDLRMLHSAAPNAGSRPRIMATYRFVREDVGPEVAEAFGWR